MMAQNIPFLFRAGTGAAAHQPARQQQNGVAGPQRVPDSVAPAMGSLPPQHAYAQNTQLPPTAMEMLAGITPEQLAFVANLFATGALTMPPQVPPPSQQVQSASRAPLSLARPAENNAAPSEQEEADAHGDADVDKEDGELEEGEVGDVNKERDFLRPPPTGPRRRSSTPRHRHARLQTGRRPSHQAQRELSPRSQQTQKPSGLAVNKASDSHQYMVGKSNGRRSRGQVEVVEKFVLALHNAGYTFPQIAAELSDPSSLRQVYLNLNLRLPAVDRAETTRPSIDISAESNGAALESFNSASNPPQEPTTKRSIVKPAPPVDRSAYLAKLQAAKNKKTEPITSATSATKPSMTVPDSVAPSQEHATATSTKHFGVAPEQPAPEPSQGAAALKQPPAVPEPPTAEQAQHPSKPAKSVIQTERVKQRMEALKAQQAEKERNARLYATQAAPSSPPPVTMSTSAATNESSSAVKSSLSGLGAGLADIAARVASQVSSITPTDPISQVSDPSPTMTSENISPIPPMQSRVFNALPGLFMGSDAAHVSPSPHQPSPISKLSEENLANTDAGATHVSEVGEPSIMVTPSASMALPPALTRKRPAAADFDDELPVLNTLPAPKRRSFGGSDREDQQQIIIQDSDDDEDDAGEGRMEVDETQNGGVTQVNGLTKLRHLGNLPSTPASFDQASGSGSRTPQLEYEKKLKEIEEWKRKIAEKEARAKLDGRTSGKSTPVKAIITLPPLEQRASAEESSEINPQTGSVDTAQAFTAPNELKSNESAPNLSGAVAERPLSAAKLALKQEKELLQERLRKLAHAGVRNLTPLTRRQTEPSIPGASQSESVPDPRRDTASADMHVAEQHEHGHTACSTVTNGELAYDRDSRGAPQVSETRNLLATAPEATSADAADISVLPGLVTSQPHRSTHAAIEMNEADTKSSIPQTAHAASFSHTQRTGESEEEEGAVDDQEPDFYGENPQLQADDAMGYEVTDDSNDVQVDAGDIVMDEALDQDDGDGGRSDTQARSGALPGTAGAVRVLQPAETDVAADTFLDVDEQSKDDEDRSYDREEDTSSAASDDGADYEPELAQSPKLHDVELQANDAEHTAAQDTPDGTPDSQNESIEMQTDASTNSSAVVQLDPSRGSFTHTTDLAPELQPQMEPQAAVSDQTSKPKNFFTPYQSPLAMFKDYRFHTLYLENVPGGYKSLTYSHNIDANTPLCPYEAAGGKCNDKTCQSQHFASMGLNDTELLRILGMHRIPAKDEEEAKRWKEGLRALVNELRPTNIGKDAAAIAARIAEYRRDFVQDPTKTLNLG